MEGLECKEVKFSDLFIDNEKFRIDDEFFMKKYICAYQKIKSNPHFILENEISVLTDFHANGSYETIAENFSLLDSVDYAYMVRTTDLETNNFTQDVKYISEQSYNFLSKSKVFGGELLINKIGTPGKCYLMPNLNKPVSLGMNLFLLRLKENSLLNEKFLYVFFNTEIGKNIINRKVNGTVPLTIDKMAIKSLFIPKLGDNIMGEVANLVDLKFDLDNQSKQKYTEAETLLLENLGLQNFQANSKPVNIKSLKESFLQTGRLDAEFYQIKYEQYWNLIQSQDYVFIRDEYLHITQKPDWTKSIYQYIEIGDVNISDGSYQTNWVETQDLPANAKIQVKQGDILISTVRPYRGAVTIIGENDQDLVVSGAFTVLRKKNNSIFNNEVLKVLLRSDLYKDWLLQFNVGTSYPVIKDEDILNLPIPKIDAKIQTQIADYVRQSNDLREQATQLLAQAKSNVELEIENISLNINDLGLTGGGLVKPLILLEKSLYWARLAEWTLLENMLFKQPDNLSIQSFSQSFGLSGRLDAEYYQPKFERLLQKLKQQNHKTLGDLVDLQKSVEVGSENYRDEGLPFVRVADFSKFGIGQTDKFVNPADFADIIRPKRDTILLSKDGTVGIAYRVPSDLEVITSGAIVHLSLKTDEILPDYLALVLNSEAVQLQAERDAGGSIIAHWKPSEILEVVIPILPKDIQEIIADKVAQSFELRKQSELLLNQAKTMVETEIENVTK